MVLAATCKGQALRFDLLDLLDLRKVNQANSDEKVPTSAAVTRTTGAHAGQGVVADRDLSRSAASRLSHVRGSSVQEVRGFAADAMGSIFCRHRAFKWLNLRSALTPERVIAYFQDRRVRYAA